MGSSERNQVCFESERKRVEKLDEEADDLGISRAQYVRERFEAGRLLFRCSSTVDMDFLFDLAKEGADSFESDGDIAEIQDDIRASILDKLPAEEDRAADVEEIHNMIYGTREERLDKIDEALQQLYDQDRVAAAFDGGYYSNEWP